MSEREETYYYIILIILLFRLIDEARDGRRRAGRVPLSNVFNNPVMIYSPGQLDRFLVGLATQPRQNFDSAFTSQLTNLLFRGNESFGMDLVQCSPLSLVES